MAWCSVKAQGQLYLATASIPALGATQLPNEWVLGLFSPGLKRPKREADHSPSSSAENKNMKKWGYTSKPHMSS